MQENDAVAGLVALAQGVRLGIFRLLVKAGPEGLAAGEIAARLKLPAASLSFHLRQLRQAGLVTVRRQRQSLIYAAGVAALNGLMGYLIEACGARGSAVVGMGADVVIYHHPGCSTSRNVLAMIHNGGIEPHVIEYLHSPPTAALLVQLIERAGLTPRSMLRAKNTPYAELGLGDLSLSDQQLVDAMMAHPILIERPLVVTALGVRLCRPSEVVLDILPLPQLGGFTKSDGEVVVDRDGKRVREERI